MGSIVEAKITINQSSSFMDNRAYEGGALYFTTTMESFLIVLDTVTFKNNYASS